MKKDGAADDDEMCRVQPLKVRWRCRGGGCGCGREAATTAIAVSADADAGSGADGADRQSDRQTKRQQQECVWDGIEFPSHLGLLGWTQAQPSSAQ